MSSVDPQSPPPPPRAQAKSSNRTLVFLAVAMAGAGIAAYAVPEVLKQVYLAEEEAKRKQPPIVGTETGKTPPPGVSTDPYASAPRPSAKPDEGPSASEKSEDDK
jgi:hypothetical protein